MMVTWKLAGRFWTGSRPLSRSSWLRFICLTAAICLFATTTSAATFFLKTGERLEGEVIHATRNTLMIRETIGAIRQLAIDEVQSVELTTPDGSIVSGALLGWQDGVYEIEAGETPIKQEETEAVAEDALDLPVLNVLPAEAIESAVTIEFNIQLSSPAAWSIYVVYGTFDRTATAGEDYRKERGSLEIEPGQTNAVLPVLLIDDDVAEDDETFHVFVSTDEAVATVVNKRAVGTILNDDN